MTFSADSLAAWEERLAELAGDLARRFPGDRSERQPVHTVYGGAHLFRSDTAAKLGQLATRALEEHAPDPGALADSFGLDAGLAGEVRARVAGKLAAEAVEDFRLDFEDGYGNRPDAEEDEDAAAAAGEVANGMAAGSLPAFVGIRIKPLSGELARRSLRTLDIFITTLATEAGSLPGGFRVTLPKIQHPEQVVVIDAALAELEDRLGVGPVDLELMVETPQMILDADGSAGVRRYVDAAPSRVRGLHFGTYDYTAALNITAAHQSMTHPSCDFARAVMAASMAGSGVWLSDGATNVMPVGDGETVRAAWRLHYEHVRHSLANGFYQGWDLHPAQLPSRYTALYAFFLEGLDEAGSRLSKFVDRAAQATLVGDVFDDAATGQGLLNYFLRALNCGAITPREATERSGLTPDELATRSFLQILEARR